MNQANLKVVPIQELSREEKIYYEAERRFLDVCDEIERGASITGYHGDVMIELLSSLQRMIIYSRGRARQ